ncbi:hypothetical protein D2V08_01335, partial [Flagellimonas lutimaris]
MDKEEDGKVHCGPSPFPKTPEYKFMIMRSRLLLALSVVILLTGCKEEDIPSYTLKLSSSGGGTATPVEEEFVEGEEATIKAFPDEHRVFKGWSGDVASTENPHTFEIYADSDVTANFEKLDSDADGVSDDIDECPETPQG